MRTATCLHLCTPTQLCLLLISCAYAVLDNTFVRYLVFYCGLLLRVLMTMESLLHGAASKCLKKLQRCVARCLPNKMQQKQKVESNGKQWGGWT